MVWRCSSLKLANCVKRYLALLIDFLIIGIIDFIILVIIVMFIEIANIQTFNTELKFIIHYLFPPLCGFILPMLYFIFLETKYNATFGKMIFKIRLRTESGEKISASRVFIRYLLFLITGVTVIGFIFYLFSKRNQFLHDWLAKTYVE